MKLSVIIPVYNDTAALPELLQRLFHVAETENYQIELLLIDDGSTDDAWARLNALRTIHPGQDIVLIRLAHNHGQHLATLCGLIRSTADIAITMDADLQHIPEAIPLLVRKLETDKLGLVYGKGSTGHDWSRRLISALYKTLASSLNVVFHGTSTFRALRRSTIIKLESLISQEIFSIDDCLREAVSQAVSVAIPHQKRRFGKSTYTWTMLASTAVKTAYHSRKLNGVTRRIGLILLALAAASMALGNSPPAFGIAIVAMTTAAAIMAAGEWITRSRQERPVAAQIKIAEIIGQGPDKGY